MPGDTAMQVTALPNPKPATSVPAAQPPAKGAFGATLNQSIANFAPKHTSPASQNKTIPKADARSVSNGNSVLEVQSKSVADTGARSPKTVPKSRRFLASQAVPKASSTSGADSDSDSHARSTKNSLLADPSVTTPVPQAVDKIRAVIDNLPPPTPFLVMPSPEPAVAAVGTISNTPAAQFDGLAPIGWSDAHSSADAAAISLDTQDGKQVAPGAGSSSIAAPSSPCAPTPVGAEPPLEMAAAQAQFSSQLSGSATRTVEAGPAQTPPVAAVAEASASSPAAPQTSAGDSRALRVSPSVTAFLITSSAPPPNSSLPGAKPAPVSDPTSATQHPSQRSQRLANVETIHARLRVLQDPLAAAPTSSDTDTSLAPQTPVISEWAPVQGAPPGLPNSHAAASDVTTVDAQPPAAANQKTVLEPVANAPGKSLALPPEDASPHDASRPSVPDQDPVVAGLTSPGSPALQSSSVSKSDWASELPKSHQVLDSAPFVPSAPTHVRSVPTINDVQMHVGIRTTAFGAVEIHTTVIQNQVGISVHGERGLAHWFSSEVPNLESGLKDHSLNLAAVDFCSDRSGVQTTTSFQHGHPRQNFSQSTGSAAAFLVRDAAPEASVTELLPPGPLVGLTGNHVSIRV